MLLAVTLASDQHLDRGVDVHEVDPKTVQCLNPICGYGRVEEHLVDDHVVAAPGHRRNRAMSAVQDPPANGAAADGRDHLARLVDPGRVVAEPVLGVRSMAAPPWVDHPQEDVEADQQMMLGQTALQGGGGGGLPRARGAHQHHNLSRRLRHFRHPSQASPRPRATQVNSGSPPRVSLRWVSLPRHVRSVRTCAAASVPGVNELLTLTATSEWPEALVARYGTVVTTFDHHSQDSGNVSWIISTDDGDLFVKTAGVPGPVPPRVPAPYLAHGDRVRLLRNAADLANSCRHPCLAPLRHVIETPAGPMLVYDRRPGELIGTDQSRRDDASSAYQRLAHLPADDLLSVLDDLISLHEALGEQGWVACDLYDGSLLFDFTTRQLTVVDLDSYHRGPITNTMGRMFGSDRFMAPEEYELGATLDHRTTVYTLARIAWHFGTRLTEHPDQFCGPVALRETLQRALRAEPRRRFASVTDFAGAWTNSLR